MKFAHMADCHVGSYRDEKMKALSIESFVKAIDISIKEKVDFILISGDLFNTSLPPIDNLKIVTTKLKELSEQNISVYVIAGSHDFSPSGKTMLDVLENAGLCINVVQGSVLENGKLKLNFTEDKKTGAKITGMIGKRGMLERSYYDSLNLDNLESESGFKIFMFHTAITELKRKSLEKMDSAPLSVLPKGFNYYAGGHVHFPLEKSLKELGGVLTYPGPLFPNSFKELEELKQGGFYLFDSNDSELLKFVPIKIKKIKSYVFNLDKKTPQEAIEEISKISQEDVKDSIVLIRLKGKLISGKPSDVDIKEIFKTLYNNGAYFVMRNTSALVSESFEDIQINNDSLFSIEEDIISENISQMNFDKIKWDKNKEKEIAQSLLELLDVEKDQGEKQSDFEERIKENIDFIDF